MIGSSKTIFQYYSTITISDFCTLTYGQEWYEAGGTQHSSGCTRTFLCRSGTTTQHVEGSPRHFFEPSRSYRCKMNRKICLWIGLFSVLVFSSQFQRQSLLVDTPTIPPVIPELRFCGHYDIDKRIVLALTSFSGRPHRDSLQLKSCELSVLYIPNQSILPMR